MRQIVQEAFREKFLAFYSIQCTYFDRQFLGRLYKEGRGNIEDYEVDEDFPAVVDVYVGVEEVPAVEEGVPMMVEDVFVEVEEVPLVEEEDRTLDSGVVVMVGEVPVTVEEIRTMESEVSMVVGEHWPVVGEDWPVVGENWPVVGENWPVVGYFKDICAIIFPYHVRAGTHEP